MYKGKELAGGENIPVWILLEVRPEDYHSPSSFTLCVSALININPGKVPKEGKKAQHDYWGVTPGRLQ